jgi:hypothetical protein
VHERAKITVAGGAFLSILISVPAPKLLVRRSPSAFVACFLAQKAREKWGTHRGMLREILMLHRELVEGKGPFGIRLALQFPPSTLCHLRSLRPLVKARAFGMTPWMNEDSSN